MSVRGKLSTNNYGFYKVFEWTPGLIVVTIKIRNMISIVIPARNEEKLLGDCLRSLKEQSYKGQYEIIIVDNGSTDNTAVIAREAGAKVVTANDQKGVAYARQAGADAAAGEIIVQADADTLYPPHWLQRISDRMDAHPKASAIAGRYFYREKFRWSWLELFIRHVLNALFALFYRRPIFVSGATFAFRTDIFVKAGGYHGLLYSADQHGIADRLKRYGKIIYAPEVFVFTSARSVRKSWPVLLHDVGVNSLHLLQYWTAARPKGPKASPKRKSWKKGLAWISSVLLALIIGFSAYGYFVPASPVFGKVYAEGKEKDKIVALTFDDGPNEPYTSQILDILKENDIQATFFVIGKNVELYPEVARRILAEGSVLGNHSYTHDANHALSLFGSRDLGHAEDVIYGITGVLPHLYRPPHGKKTPWELAYAKKSHLIEVMWNASANDQHQVAFIGKPTPESYAKQIVKNVKPGSIILLHDGYGLNHDGTTNDKSITVQALPLIIQQLRDKGYTFVTVPVLLNVPAYNPAP
jgi:peptidoglycan/xylan/chitin deacetylase (PgdA/CDA1 family)